MLEESKEIRPLGSGIILLATYWDTARIICIRLAFRLHRYAMKFILAPPCPCSRRFFPLLGMAVMYACYRAGFNPILRWSFSVALSALVYLFNIVADSISEERAENFMYVYAPVALALLMSFLLLWASQQKNWLWHLRRYEAARA